MNITKEKAIAELKAIEQRISDGYITYLSCGGSGDPNIELSLDALGYAIEYMEAPQVDNEEIMDAICAISDMKAQYSIFEPKEADKYHACSLAIQALRTMLHNPSN